MSESSDAFARGVPWDIPIVGGTVVQVRIDFSFGLLIDGPSAGGVSCEVRISSPFRYESGQASGTIDPEQTERLAPLLVLHNATVRSAFATEPGQLELRFEADRTIIVPPDPHYEAWQLSVTNQATTRTTGLISLPGSGTAVFDSP